MKLLSVFILLICQVFFPIYAANILGVFVFCGKSHFMMTKALIKELLQRGHKVTFITSFPLEENSDNLTEIVIPPYDFWTDIKNKFNTHNLFDLTEMSLPNFFSMVHLLGLKTTEHSLQQPKVQAIINDTSTKYDLLLAEQFYQEAFLALAYKYDIPIVTMSTLGFENYMSQMMGVITPWSFVPHGFLSYEDRMTFYERIMNTIYNLYEDFDREFMYFPQQDELVKKYFSHLSVQIPSVSKMEKSISAILLNSHVPLTTPRPYITGLVQVGGLHIKPPKSLPKSIKEFLDGAKNGVIYFSLGTNLQSSDMPPEKVQAFLNVFKKLKQRVLWKWEDENIPELPDNLMIQKWMPQSDILAHPNVKVFITHGGLFGTQEGIYYGIPMLGIPIYCDQNLNVNKAVKSGYAVRLNFPNITEASLTWALKELLYNPSYRNIAQRNSIIFRDRPMSAMDTAMYWIDYIIRYKGASQIRSAGLDLPWYSYYLLDVIAVLLIPPILLLLVLYKIVSNILMKNDAKSTRSIYKKIN